MILASFVHNTFSFSTRWSLNLYWNELTMHVWVYFWALYSDLFIYTNTNTTLFWLLWLYDKSGSQAWAFLMAQIVKNLPTMRETQVRFLGQEDPLEKGMATHSSILAWRIPQMKEPGRLQSTGSNTTEWLTLEVRQCRFSNFFLLFQSFLSILRILLFHMNFRIVLSMSKKNPPGNLIALNL